MTTRDVYDRHLRNELTGDLDTILSDYAPDAIAATPEGIGSGHDHIRAIYERMLPLLTSLELTSSIQVLGDVLYLTFRAHRNGRDELVGTDTFVIHDDLIQCTPSTAPPRARRPTTGRERPRYVDRRRGHRMSLAPDGGVQAFRSLRM